MSTETTVTTSETQPVVLGIADIAFIVEIIDAASKRGAFGGEELQMIGSYRNKVNAWVKQNSPTKTTEATEETPPPVAGTESTAQ